MRGRSRGAPPLTEALGGAHSEGGADGTGETSTGECNRSPGGGVPLPCQNSHNSIIGGGDETPDFPPSARRTAFALQVNVQGMCERHGLEKVGFLTLTFADHVLDARVAQRRMNSLSTNVLRPRYGEHIRVIERQKSGRIHYHLLVAVGADIRTGCDFSAFERRDYRSAPPALRAEWAFWRGTARRYRFGRTELLPVMSTEQAIGRYVGKYISKHIEHRELRDRRVRLVSYSGARVASTRFAWASPGAMEWRRKLAAFVQMLHEAGAIESPTMGAMAEVFGSRWVWKWRDSIMTFPLPENAEALGGAHGEEFDNAEEGAEGDHVYRECDPDERAGVYALHHEGGARRV